VEQVETAMRRRPGWYASYVDGPLGRKQAPVLPGPRGDCDRITEPAPLPLVEQYEVDDAYMLAMAGDAVDAIRAGLARGERPERVVAGVLRTAFTGGTGREDFARLPLATAAEGERAAALVTDPAVVKRVSAAILDILRARS
jgi:hypothetical protein